MIRKALTYLLTAPLLLAASCVTEGEHPDIVEVPDSGNMLTMRLKLDMGLEGRTASGESDPSFEVPEGDFESVSTLRVIILRGNDNTVEAARIVNMKDGVPDNDKLEFKVRSNEMKTIILIANELSLPSPDPDNYETASDYLIQFMTRPNATVKISESQMQQLMEWKAAMPGTLPDATAGLFSDSKYGKHLPLAEIFKVQAIAPEPTGNSDDDENKNNDVDVIQNVTLFMPYAAAKATFYFTADDGYKDLGSKVTGIRLLGINWSEYVFPKETTYSPAKYTAQGEGYVSTENSKRYITDFAAVDLPAGREGMGSYTYTPEEPVVIKKYAADDPDAMRGPIYFPESINKFETTDEQSIINNFRVQVQLEGLEWFDAQPLTDNILHVDGFDAIARNTHLQIHIKFGASSITWEAIEAPYNTVTLGPGFGI